MNKSLNIVTRILASTAALICSFVSLQSNAQSPWVLEQGQQSYSFIYVAESFTEKWLGDVSSPIAEISQQTAWVNIAYGLTDNLQLSLNTGYTQSEFDASAMDFSGRADSRLGLKYMFMDEFQGKSLSASVEAAAIVRGSYERSSAGNPHSPGDRANGFELSAPVAKFFGSVLVSGQLGYRFRSDDVPDQIFYSAAVGTNIKPVFLQLRYLAEDSRDGLDVGQPPFTPNDFHLTEEDREVLELGAYVDVGRNVMLYFGIAEVLYGRNTGDSSIFYLGVNFKR